MIRYTAPPLYQGTLPFYLRTHTITSAPLRIRRDNISLLYTTKETSTLHPSTAPPLTSPSSPPQTAALEFLPLLLPSPSAASHLTSQPAAYRTLLTKLASLLTTTTTRAGASNLHLQVLQPFKHSNTPAGIQTLKQPCLRISTTRTPLPPSYLLPPPNSPSP